MSLFLNLKPQQHANSTGMVAGWPVNYELPAGPTDAATTAGADSKSVQATIVTREHILSDGKKVLLVAPDQDGRVVRTAETRKPLSLREENSLLDTRASDAYIKGLCAKENN